VYDAAMVSRSRWLALLALVGCDHGSPPSGGQEAPAAPRAGVALACDDTPFEQMPANCDAPDRLLPVDVAEIDPNLVENPTLRSVDALVRLGAEAEAIIAVGSYDGGASPDGAWWAAIDPAGATLWSGSFPAAADVAGVFATGDADGLWVVAAQVDDTTVVQHFGADGVFTGEATLVDFTATSALPQTGGAVALFGTSEGATAWAGVDPTGAETYNGNQDLTPGPHLVAQGTVQYFDGPGGTPVWEHDPRGVPDDGFPLEIGVEQGIINSVGDVLAMGSVLGPLGDNTLLVRLDPGGRPRWALNRPRAHGEVVLEGLLDSSIVVGQSFYCRPGTYYVVFDDVGGIVEDGLLPAPPEPWVLNSAYRLTSVALEGDVLTMRAFAIDFEVPKR
jgi:hypothetical protein